MFLSILNLCMRREEKGGREPCGEGRAFPPPPLFVEGATKMVSADQQRLGKVIFHVPVHSIYKYSTYHNGVLNQF